MWKLIIGDLLPLLSSNPNKKETHPGFLFSYLYFLSSA